ncbi:hypothetical protein HDV00_011868 [Rhizophlyctis rosea]|nr:hypothetical protein HDV00_011868 [Rhizophlyctis rosea]
MDGTSSPIVSERSHKRWSPSPSPAEKEDQPSPSESSTAETVLANSLRRPDRALPRYEYLVKLNFKKLHPHAASYADFLELEAEILSSNCRQPIVTLLAIILRMGNSGMESLEGLIYEAAEHLRLNGCEEVEFDEGMREAHSTLVRMFPSGMLLEDNGTGCIGLEVDAAGKLLMPFSGYMKKKRSDAMKYATKLGEVSVEEAVEDADIDWLESVQDLLNMTPHFDFEQAVFVGAERLPKRKVETLLYERSTNTTEWQPDDQPRPKKPRCEPLQPSQPYLDPDLLTPAVPTPLSLDHSCWKNTVADIARHGGKTALLGAGAVMSFGLGWAMGSAMGGL